MTSYGHEVILRCRGTPAVERLDRRQRRRQASIEEVLDTSLAVLTEYGAAGLSLGEVARRMGIRPPSLYVYVESKNAVYDALFARGYQEISTALEPVHRDLPAAAEGPEYLLRLAREFVRWGLANPGYAQLMFWRPVPGYEPSAQAYAPSVELWRRSRELFIVLQERGVLCAGDVDDALLTWTVLISGVSSQQLANAPAEGLDGTFTALLPQLVDMWLARYGVPVADQRIQEER